MIHISVTHFLVHSHYVNLGPKFKIYTGRSNNQSYLSFIVSSETVTFFDICWFLNDKYKVT